MRSLVLLLAACSAADTGPFPTGASPAYDQVWQIATHNSYWVDRGVPGDLYASGVSERILDQLLVDHARAVELDIHRDLDVPHGFRVYHSLPGNTLCTTLPECLGVLRAFHRAVPAHEAVTVVIEMKELFRSLWDADHTIADLDALLDAELGPLLFRPREVLARCPAGATLSACVAAVGWPSIAALRGKFLVAILGNWDQLGGQDPADWVAYATHADPAAFPMASAWQLDWDALGADLQQLYTREQLAAATAQSAFLQTEAIDDPLTVPTLARRGVVRVDNAFGDAGEASAVAGRMQLLQSDDPAAQHDDRGPAQPFRAFDAAVARAETTEPGARLALASAGFAHVSAGAGRWEATVSFGADATRTGCLRAATAAGDTSASLCARKVSAPGMADNERLYVGFAVCRAGACATTEVGSADNSPGGVGELLALDVGGDGCVTASAARLVGPDLAPFWTPVGAKECFDAPLSEQGVTGPITFFGLTRAGRPLAAAELTGTVVDLSTP